MALTNDSWALDSRLDRIRLRVELLLVPRTDGRSLGSFWREEDVPSRWKR